MYTSEMMGRPTLASTVQTRSLAVGPRTGSDGVAGGRSTQSPEGDVDVRDRGRRSLVP